MKKTFLANHYRSVEHLRSRLFQQGAEELYKPLIFHCLTVGIVIHGIHQGNDQSSGLSPLRFLFH